jgi:hypothetical protein
LPPEPKYPIDKLTAEDAKNPDVVIKAIAATIQLQQDYIKGLKKIFN